MDHQNPHVPEDSSIVHRLSSMAGGRTPARLAAIDVGTNTIRLLIGEPDGRGGYRPVLGAQEITRLGQGLLPDRTLQPEPMRRSLEVLARFRRLCADHGVAAIAAGGTSALREARNRDEFLSRARREADLEIALISGEEEARLTLLGIRAALDPPPRSMLMLDIGGGSTELLLADGPRILGLVSTGLGAVKLTGMGAHPAHELLSPKSSAAEHSDGGFLASDGGRRRGPIVL